MTYEYRHFEKNYLHECRRFQMNSGDFAYLILIDFGQFLTADFYRFWSIPSDDGRFPTVC